MAFGKHDPPQPGPGPEPLPTTGRLSGFVYLDRNRNGVYDAGRDFGIATIRVILTGVDDRGEVALGLAQPCTPNTRSKIVSTCLKW